MDNLFNLVFFIIIATLIEKTYGSVCPPEEDISPCSCFSINTGNSLYCANKDLDDAQLGAILDVYSASGVVSPLVGLVAENNKLTSIPNRLTSKFKNLTYIDLSDNQITGVYSGSFNIVSPSTSVFIDLSNNLIATIKPRAFNISSTEPITIFLFRNQIAKIITGAFHLESKSAISIWMHLNQITVIPTDVFNLTSITGSISIDLSLNQINKIQPGAFNLQSPWSVYLYLVYNKITTIPTGAFNLDLKSFVNIDLSHNSIASIQTNAFNITSQSTVNVDLRFNQISVIHSSAFTIVGSVIWLYLRDGNLISTIPPGAFHLNSTGVEGAGIVLDLSGNQIDTIRPGAIIANSSSSLSLSLNQNNLTEIPAHVFEFTSTISRIYLDLSKNQISTLHHRSFQGHFNLIFFNSNNLSRFDSVVFKSTLLTMMMNYYNKDGSVGPEQAVYLTDNPINCNLDFCHLAWLIRDNRYLLNFVRDGRCCNGTDFVNLDPNGYSNCPISL